MRIGLAMTETSRPPRTAACRSNARTVAGAHGHPLPLARGEDVSDGVHQRRRGGVGGKRHFFEAPEVSVIMPEALDSHPVQQVEGLDHGSVGQPAVGLQQHGLLLAAPENRPEPVAQQPAGDRGLVDVVEASREIESTIGSSRFDRRFVVAVFGSATEMPWCSIGAVTMKMISSTSITSTSGVTLMSARWSNGSPDWRWKAMLLEETPRRPR